MLPFDTGTVVVVEFEFLLFVGLVLLSVDLPDELVDFLLPKTVLEESSWGRLMALQVFLVEGKQLVLPFLLASLQSQSFLLLHQFPRALYAHLFAFALASIDLRQTEGRV